MAAKQTHKNALVVTYPAITRASPEDRDLIDQTLLRLCPTLRTSAQQPGLTSASPITCATLPSRQAYV